MPGGKVTFGKDLGNMLGAHFEEYTSSAIYHTTMEIDVYQGTYSIFVYCDVVEPRIVGDIMTLLLVTVPIEGSHGDYIHKPFEKIHYHPLLRKHFTDSYFIFSKKIATHLTQRFEREGIYCEVLPFYFYSSKMRVAYCCDGKAYESFYVNQVGSGLYRGTQYQRGYGLGNIFSSIRKSILPLIKSGAMALGKQALHRGVAFASDVFSGQNAKQAAVRRAKEVGSNLFQRAVKRNIPQKRLQKKRRKRNNDIFG